MELQRKTIENDLDFLRQISTDIDFETDNYMEWINLIKKYCQKISAIN